MGEYTQKEINGYKILFYLNDTISDIYDTILNIYVKSINNKQEFKPLQIKYKESFDENFSDFKDLLQKIKEESEIKIYLTEKLFNNYVKFLILSISNIVNSKVFISKKIYSINVKYYLTKGPNNKRINSNPYSSYIEKDYFNIDDIYELIKRENILDNYLIDSFKYQDESKKAFRTIKDEFIQINEKIILEFHINGIKNSFIRNLKLRKKYVRDEIIKIKSKVNRYSDILTKYDLVYLFSSPMIKNENYQEHESPISYMQEISTIIDLMENSKKAIRCKFECIGEDVFRDVLNNYQTKILHISAHGCFDGKKYSLCLENLKDKGQNMLMNIQKLEYLLLNSNKINLSQIDLVVVSTCYSEDFANLFIKYGVKNVIYIKKRTEVIDEISLKFVKYFYKELFEGKSIKESFDISQKKLQNDEDVKFLNSYSRCKNHFHYEKDVLQFEHEEFKEKYRECNCNEGKHNYHKIDCEYYKFFLNKVEQTEKTKKEIKKDVYAICCCDHEIEHDEISKIALYESSNKDNLNISPFEYNAKGKLFINSNIRFYYDVNKFISIKCRKSLVGRIFNSLTNKEKFSILFGKKYMGKLDFAESLCVYLYLRLIIYDYEIFRINTEEDFNYTNSKLLNENKNKKYNCGNKKNIKIINFDMNDNIVFDYLVDIYSNFCNDKFNELYFIFIFNISEENEEQLIKNIEKNFETRIKKKIKIEEYKNLFSAELNEDDLKELLKDLTKGIKITNKELRQLLKISQNKHKNIITISELCLKGKKVSEISEIIKTNNTMVKYIEIENKSSYLLYYLLTIMPSGLPDCFLEIIFKEYAYIKDKRHFIVKSIDNNWNIIKNDLYFKENLKEIKYSKEFFEYLYRSLKLYTNIINYFIDKNRKKILFKGGIIHYVFNAYNNSGIWKNSNQNKIYKLLGKKILNKDFNIIRHKQNIIHLLYLIINNIGIIRKSMEQKGKLDDLLENILLLFPSYFFLKKDNLEVLQISIDLCNKLIEKTKDTNDDSYYKKREEYLKNKLLLYLYSIDKSKNEIINIKKELEIEYELKLLQIIRNDKKTIENIKELFEENISDDMKFILYYEISFVNFKEGKYNLCEEYLNKAFDSSKRIDDIIKNRILIDYNYIFMRKFTKDNKKDLFNKHLKNVRDRDKKLKEDFKIIKSNAKKLKQIVKNPFQKNLYYEAHRLRQDIYNLLEPNIIMLNSNPLKKITNCFCYPNNQYYILKHLKNNIQTHIRIKPDILNIENLNYALKREGEILILQSDDFTENGDIICESEKGRGALLKRNDLIKIFQKQKINYKIIILCYPNSSLIIEDFDKYVDYHYLITFENFDISKYDDNIMKDYNKQTIQFIIDFIMNSSVNKNVEKIIDSAKKKFKENIKNIKERFNLKQCIIIKQKNILVDSKIEYIESIEEKKVFLYGSIPRIKTYFEDTSQDYSPQIYDLIEYLNYEKGKILYCDISNKREYLYIIHEVMKFFYRHKTFCELFDINIGNVNEKILLKSIIRKLENMGDEYDGEEEEEEKEEEDEEYSTKKSCFIIIYNCKWNDLIGINTYSILNNNGSFLILCDVDNVLNDNKQEKIAIGISEDSSIFFILFEYDKLNFIDESFIFSELKEEYDLEDLNEDNIKSYIINNKLDLIKNGNLYLYLKSVKQQNLEEYFFPFGTFAYADRL